MEKVIALILTILLVVSAVPPKAHIERTYAILGDSWSTFKDYTDNPWYPAIWSDCEGYGSGNDVMFVHDAWWYPLDVVENKSYSGSPVCYDGYGAGKDDAKEYSFVKRVQGITTQADVIIVQGGLNDESAGAELGEYKYEGWTDEDFTTFRPALAYVLWYLKEYTDSEILFMKCTCMDEGISESIDVICGYYGVDMLELHDIELTGWHPNRNGMREIRNQVIERSDENADY